MKPFFLPLKIILCIFFKSYHPTQMYHPTHMPDKKKIFKLLFTNTYWTNIPCAEERGC